MIISDVKVFPVAEFVYVKIVTEAGLYGIGEASLGGRSLAVVGALDHLKPVLVGQDVTRIEHIWQDIFRGTFWRGGPVLQSALAGIDIALWDLAGKALGVPTYRLRTLRGTACGRRRRGGDHSRSAHAPDTAACHRAVQRHRSRSPVLRGGPDPLRESGVIQNAA